MKLTKPDIEFAKDGILDHLEDAIQHIKAHIDGLPQEEGKPPHRVQARYRLNAVSYIISDLKKHLHNDELMDEQEDWEALDTQGEPPLKE